MTLKDIDKITTEYLNSEESESDMQDVFKLAKEALQLKKAIRNIRSDIKNAIEDYPTEESPLVLDARTIDQGISLDIDYGKGLGLKRALGIICKKTEELMK